MTHNFANTWLEATGFTYLALAVKSIDLDLALTLVSMISSMVMIRLFFVTFFTIFVVMSYYYSLVCSMCM